MRDSDLGAIRGPLRLGERCKQAATGQKAYREVSGVPGFEGISAHEARPATADNCLGELDRYWAVDMSAMTKRGIEKLKGLRERRVRRSDRGIAAVEYALLISLVALPTVSATEYTTDMVSGIMQETSAGLVGPKAPTTTAAPTTTSSTSTSTSTTTTSTPTSSTTTTAPTTTTSTTTSTTTTTTSTTTTTAPPAAEATAAMSTPSAVTFWWGRFWAASTTLTLADAADQPVAGAEVEVAIRYKRVDGKGRVSWTEETVVLTTASDGSVEVESSLQRRKGGKKVTRIKFELTGMTHDSYSWDGADTSVTAYRP